jgi:hypothetical protein
MLTQLAMMGLTITEMCSVAEISRRTFYNYCNKNKTFLPYLQSLQKRLISHAKRNIAVAIMNEDGKKEGIPINSWKFIDHQVQLAKLQIQKMDIDTPEEEEHIDIFIPKTSSYNESLTNIQKLLNSGK